MFPIFGIIFISKWKPPSGICSGWKYQRLIWLFVEKRVSYFPEDIDEWSPDTQQRAKFRGVKLIWLHLWKLAMNLIQNDMLWICGDSKGIQGPGTNTGGNGEDPSSEKMRKESYSLSSFCLLTSQIRRDPQRSSCPPPCREQGHPRPRQAARLSGYVKPNVWLCHWWNIFTCRDCLAISTGCPLRSQASRNVKYFHLLE